MEIRCRCRETHGYDICESTCKPKRIPRKLKKKAKKVYAYVYSLLKKHGSSYIDLNDWIECNKTTFRKMLTFLPHYEFTKKYEDTIFHIIKNMDESYLSMDGDIRFLEEYDNGLYVNTYEIEIVYEPNNSYSNILLEILNIDDETIDTYSNIDCRKEYGIKDFKSLIKYVDRYRKNSIKNP